METVKSYPQRESESLKYPSSEFSTDMHDREILRTSQQSQMVRGIKYKNYTKERSEELTWFCAVRLIE